MDGIEIHEAIHTSKVRMTPIARIRLALRNATVRLGWTAWPIWRNLENPFKGRYQKVEKSAKNQILQNKSKRTRETPQDVFRDF